MTDKKLEYWSPGDHERGFTAAFGYLIDRDVDWIPEAGIPDLNEEAFFKRFMAELIEPDFLLKNDEYRDKILEGLRNTVDVKFETVSGRWDSLIPPFSLHEDQWVEFIMNVHDRLLQIREEASPD